MSKEVKKKIARKLTCTNCKEKFDKEELTYINTKKKLCKSCLEEHEKKTPRKLTCTGCKQKFDKEELTYINTKKKLCKNCLVHSRRDSQEYRELIEFLCIGFNIKAPTGKLLSQIKEFKDLGYSYRDIHLTVYYIYVIEKRRVEETSIGLMPFYYEKAMKHFEMIENARRTADGHVAEVKVIEVPIKRNKPCLKNTRLINISEIQ